MRTMLCGSPQQIPLWPSQLIKKKIIRPFGLSIAETAQLLHVSDTTVRNLLKCHPNGRPLRPVSAEMAVRLERLTGTLAEGWCALQSAVDIWVVRTNDDLMAELDEIRPLPRLTRRQQRGA